VLADRTPTEFASQIAVNRDLAETKQADLYPYDWHRKFRPFIP
jgi:hypothetical protein